MKVTVRHLKKLGACTDQVNLFKETFGDSVDVTKENCIIANKVGIDFEWAAGNLLNDKQRKTYKEAEAPHLKAYEEAVAPLWKAYKEAVAPHQETYREARAPHRETFEEARAVSFYEATLI